MFLIFFTILIFKAKYFLYSNCRTLIKFWAWFKHEIIHSYGHLAKSFRPKSVTVAPSLTSSAFLTSSHLSALIPRNKNCYWIVHWNTCFFSNNKLFGGKIELINKKLHFKKCCCIKLLKQFYPPWQLVIHYAWKIGALNGQWFHILKDKLKLKEKREKEVLGAIYHLFRTVNPAQLKGVRAGLAVLISW